MTGFLLGLKRLLVSWGFNKQQISVDIESMIIHNEDKMIARILEQDGQFELEWAAVWQKWQEFLHDKEVKVLVTKF